MTPELPDELLLSLSTSIPCRDTQIRQLLQLIGPTSIRPSTLVIHGVAATGKSLTIDSLLKVVDAPSAIVRSKECITTRHLLEKAISGLKNALKSASGAEISANPTGKCESISAFVVELQNLLEGRENCYLVFDGIDKQREAAPTLLPAIARLGEIIPNLTTILILSSALPHALHHSSIPHLQFPPYTKAEILSIACLHPLPLNFPVPEDSDVASSPPPYTYSDEDSKWLWSKFVTTIWDALGQSAARDITSFRTVCERLWEPFIKPVLDGHYGVREFSKLLIRNRGLLQGETALMESIVPIPITVSSIKSAQPQTTLPYYPAYLLCAAYLASHTPSKHDITLFSKTSLSKRKKRGGGTALSSGRVSKHRKISRRLLGPQAFVLERMSAIFHAILPHGYQGGGADIMFQFATLTGLRLVVKAGAGLGAGDVLDAGTKWRVGVEWEFVRGVARGVGFDVESYVVE